MNLILNLPHTLFSTRQEKFILQPFPIIMTLKLFLPGGVMAALLGISFWERMAITP